MRSRSVPLAMLALAALLSAALAPAWAAWHAADHQGASALEALLHGHAHAAGTPDHDHPLSGPQAVRAHVGASPAAAPAVVLAAVVPAFEPVPRAAMETRPDASPPSVSSAILRI